jgi:hypothetical protein
MRQTKEVPAAAVRGRQMYVDGDSIVAILRETGLTKYALYFWIDGGTKVNGTRLLDPIPRRQKRVHKMTPASRRMLVGRIMQSSHQQVGEIERRFNPSPGQLDRDARTLAVIARTLNELTAIDERNREMNRKATLKNDQSRSGEQPIPRDIEELRRSVSRKLQNIIAAREDNI